MKLDDMLDIDPDPEPNHESQWQDIDPPELEWDENDVTALVDSITGPQHSIS